MPATATQSAETHQALSQAPKRSRGWLRTAAESIVLTAASIALLEGFFAIAGVGQQEFLEPDLQLGCHHIPGKVVTWRLEGYSNDRLTDSGLRDIEHNVAKSASVIRVALLGDSSTEGLQVPLSDTYCRVLEKALNLSKTPGVKGKKFEVINFACSSYSTGQQYLQYESQVVKYHPDIVILLYNRGDAVENVFVPSAGVLSAPRPYFYLDGSHQVQCDRAVLEAASSKLKPNPVLEFLRRNSRIYGVWTETNLVLSLNEPRFRKIASWFGKLTSRFEKNDRASTWTVPYGKQSPLLVTEALITKLGNQAKADKSQFILAMFPNTINDTEFAQQEKRFEVISKNQGFSYIDFTPCFTKGVDTKSLFLQYHFSSNGHRLVAEKLQPLIESISERSNGERNGEQTGEQSTNGQSANRKEISR